MYETANGALAAPESRVTSGVAEFDYCHRISDQLPDEGQYTLGYVQG